MGGGQLHLLTFGNRLRDIFEDDVSGIQEQNAEPTLPAEMRFLVKLVQYNAPMKKLKKALRRGNIPEEKWSNYIETTKQYIADYEVWIHSDEDDISREEGVTVKCSKGHV